MHERAEGRTQLPDDVINRTLAVKCSLLLLTTANQRDETSHDEQSASAESQLGIGQELVRLFARDDLVRFLHIPFLFILFLLLLFLLLLLLLLPLVLRFLILV